MEYKDILRSLHTLSGEELEKLIDETIRVRKLKAAMSPVNVMGGRVQFDAKTRGIIKGRIIKINRATSLVLPDDGGTTWKVAHALLEKVED